MLLTIRRSFVCDFPHAHDIPRPRRSPRLMPSRLLLSFALLIAVPSAFATDLAWPAVRPETKPWTRWWWLGNIADEKSLTASMEACASVGLGGLEITPIYGVHGYEKQFVPFLSPRWVGLLEHTLAEGRRLELGIDLANGTGWPFGGPWVTDRDAAHYLAHRIFEVEAGSSFTQRVAFEQKPVLRFAGPRRVALDTLKQPVATNDNLQELAIDQVRFKTPLPLVSLMAYRDNTGPAIDLTDRVDARGELNWTAPAGSGRWTLYALFLGQHGKMVERAAPGAEGYAIDHLSSTALDHYLARFDEAFAGRDLSGLRAFFNDSYEVDDSEGESDFTPRFFAEFQRLRGYDLRQQLPRFFHGDEQVLSDYRETVSDLLLEQFTQPWRAWANRRGVLIRNQAHNAPANILDLYVASDIPEQEGNGRLAMKLASSAAHLTGKPLAAAEIATWLNEHFLTTLSELKDNADDFFLGGINHVVYHGTALSPADDPWPGFQFYASVELSPANPFWQDFGALNTYVARVQSFLQHGEGDEDVLLYYNIHDRWAERGNGAMPHFGHGRDPIGTSAAATGAALLERGVGFDFISDRLLASAPVSRYRAIVLPDTRHMPVDTLARLVQLASDGATVLVVGELPRRAPGFLGPQRQPEFDRLLAQIRARLERHGDTSIAPVGRGRFILAPDVDALLAASRLPQEKLVSLGLEYVRRRTPEGAAYFLVNRSDRPLDAWVPFNTSADRAAQFEPMTGQLGLAALRKNQDSASHAVSEVYLQLAPGASTIVQFRHDTAQAPAWSYWRANGEAVELREPWQVHFVRGGPQLPADASLTALSSWTDFAGDLGRAFSGTATYTTTFPRPSGGASAFELDLGHVADSARVTLNGRELATLIRAPWRVTIPADQLRDENTLTISVTNLAANRIADLDRRGVTWKKFYNANMPARRRENVGPDGLFTAARWTPRNSGLLGPVKLGVLVPLQPPSTP